MKELDMSTMTTTAQVANGVLKQKFPDHKRKPYDATDALIIIQSFLVILENNLKEDKSNDK